MSHTFEHLSQNQSQHVASEAMYFSERVPLNHAIFGAHAEQKFYSILKTGLLEVLTPGKRYSTASSESILGIPPAVYFYAGRVYDGRVAVGVLMFGGQLDIEADDGNTFETIVQGAASPFDSGGLAKDRLLLKWNEMPSTVSKQDYLAKHSQPLHKWRMYLALFLSDFFSNVEAYLSGLPKCAIDNRSFDTDNGGAICDSADTRWRNWTFEIRAYTDVPTRIARRVYVDYDIGAYVSKLAREFPHVASVLPRLCQHDDPANAALADVRRSYVGKSYRQDASS